MSTYLIAVTAHVLLGIALVGYALFWAVLSAKGRGERAASGTADEASLLDLVNRTPWPPRGLPVPVRLPLWGVGWVLFVAVILTGGYVIGQAGLGSSLFSGPFELVSLRTKMIGVGLGGLWLLLATLRPRRGPLLLLFLTLLAIVVLSGVLVR